MLRLSTSNFFHNWSVISFTLYTVSSSLIVVTDANLPLFSVIRSPPLLPFFISLLSLSQRSLYRQSPAHLVSSDGEQGEGIKPGTSSPSLSVCGISASELTVFLSIFQVSSSALNVGIVLFLLGCWGREVRDANLLSVNAQVTNFSFSLL